jgi:NADH-quinone oxidoreductase subunit J
MQIAFYIAALIMLAAAAGVIASRDVVHAVLHMVLSVLALAVVLAIIGAPFIAAIVIIINAGAIVILFLFLMMMLNLGPKSVEQERKWLKLRFWPGPIIIGLVLLAEFIYIFLQTPPTASGNAAISPVKIGITLFGDYLAAVEIVSALLLSALVGAYHLGRQGEPEKGGRP